MGSRTDIPNGETHLNSLNEEGVSHSHNLGDTDIELQSMGGSRYEVDDVDRDDGEHHEGERNEQWALLKRSNKMMRSVRKIWDGPDEPYDEPPEFLETHSVIKIFNEFPVRTFQKRIGTGTLSMTILFIYCAIWFGTNFFFLYPHFVFKAYYIPSDLSSDKIPIISLDCNSYLNWEGTNNACGLFGENCNPFEDKEYYIKCPALCDMGGIAYSAIAVGSKRVKYTNYIIGGGTVSDLDERSDGLYSNPFRADSYPCASATHLGLLSPLAGGCARVSMTGSQVSFPSAEGRNKMGWSISFGSFFPSSYSFKSINDGYFTNCLDPRFPLLTLNILYGIPVFYLYESIYGYWTTMISAYWTLVLVLDPPFMIDTMNRETVYSLFSIGFQRLLPLCFILYVMWKVAVKRTLEGGSPVLKVILWYPLFWLGVMNNVTFDRLPVDRLNLKDLKEQQGALLAVGSIITTILVCAIVQAYMLWKSGRFKKYFKIYISFIAGIGILGSLPGLNLRIHHYILGMVLVPGCATRSLTAYLFQGILIGLIISGVGRWDFASIVETNYALLRDEAGASLSPPSFTFDPLDNHKISWSMPSNNSSSNLEVDSGNGVDWHGKIDGYSLLLNDLEVYVGNNETVDLDLLINDNQMLKDMVNKSLDELDGSVDIYLRVARASIKAPEQYRGDYTNAGILVWPEGAWYDPLPGVS
ncbi:similar to Saccharomyces cerevisiae YIL067C Uncharacterized protein of unknown function [Maudiozyma saulgeensis]|uniref:Uncharacterized protein n=1 Tax=Maudiozyma saulgeensis TaxID=1789683 RepID=A0A1X7QXZ2_9SACH|nr:similar to Saccharomyces cerevisiae YIL067C Uncharacterized protein of unknown function [Kazachstania saulgeensis]